MMITDGTKGTEGQIIAKLRKKAIIRTKHHITPKEERGHTIGEDMMDMGEEGTTKVRPVILAIVQPIPPSAVEESTLLTKMIIGDHMMRGDEKVTITIPRETMGIGSKEVTMVNATHEVEVTLEQVAAK